MKLKNVDFGIAFEVLKEQMEIGDKYAREGDYVSAYGRLKGATEAIINHCTDPQKAANQDDITALGIFQKPGE